MERKECKIDGCAKPALYPPGSARYCGLHSVWAMQEAVRAVQERPRHLTCIVCGGELLYDGQPAWVCDRCNAEYDDELERVMRD